MASTTAIRIWRVNNDAGRPWPVLIPEDDFLDYMVMEAVALRVRNEDRKAEREQRIAEWKKEEQKRLSDLVNNPQQ